MRFDERIHRFTWEAAGNPYLVETLERYFTHSLRIWYLVLDRLPGLGHAVHDQTHLLEALLAGRRRPRPRDHARARARLPARDPRGVQPELSGGCQSRWARTPQSALVSARTVTRRLPSRCVASARNAWAVVSASPSATWGRWAGQLKPGGDHR